MNILHVTDLHFNTESYEKLTQSQMIQKFILTLDKMEESIDLVIFSGDLVFKGDDLEEFKNAKKQFLDQIAEALQINTDQIILCAGNHDMDRNFKSKSLETRFENEVNSLDKLYGFFKDKDIDYVNSLKPTDNYNRFIKGFYQSNDTNKITDLYTLHKRGIDGKNVGIISINSSWRSVDDTSNGKLLFPTHLLEEALFELKGYQCIFIVLHHPIHWFRDFNQAKLQELIYKNCNIMFSGHIHESEITTHYKQNNGIFAHVSPASLTWDKQYVGFSTIKYEINTAEKAVVSKFHFSKERDDFEFVGKVAVSIPCGVEKADQNRTREKIQLKLTTELLEAKNLLLTNTTDVDNDNLFMDLFNKPKIKLTPKQELQEKGSSAATTFDFDKLLINENNYFIYGYDKSGKSTLLKYVQIYHLKNYSKNGSIPFYIDFKEIDSKDLIDEIRKYYSLSREKTKEIIKNHNFRLLVDNFDINHPFFPKLSKFLEEFPDVNFIITCDYITSRLYDDYIIDSRHYQKIYLHDISRNDVRTYIEKNSLITNETNDSLLDKVISFCKQIELPLNYWTVSLIMLIHKKSRFDISKNIYNLLDLCVDEILDKKFRALKNSKVSFSQIKSICGELAKFLLLNNSENNYSKKYSEILVELETYIKNNTRIKAEGKEVLDYLVSSGVLKVKEDDRISFRLNGIFEFFIAFYISEHKEFMEEVLNDKVYLSFKNEFEIYSGMKNEDIDFLNLIFDKTFKYFSPINETYDLLGDADTILVSKVSDKNDINLKSLTQALQPADPITNEEKDMLKDNFDQVSINSEIAVKRHYDVSQLDPEIYERYISILARVFKTMDGVTDAKLLSKILDFLLQTYINFGFYLIEQIEQDAKDFDSIQNDNLLETISRILPFISQVNMTDNIAQYNIEKVILQKIDELKVNYRTNQYKLFILYLILMDTDEDNIYTYCDELIDLMEIGVLKYSTILKLNYYLVFKGNKNRKLSDFLKQKIKLAQLKLDNKTDKDSLQRQLDNKTGKFFNK
ncbi:metallophosphoesterase [Pedobacter agri]|uniref:metallophosphoesterase n=1 Tax=Pedobacter agri TaxID=454586 RepID=UPI002930DC77|nr:metallophosphoesterase [Pedobacter agri]